MAAFTYTPAIYRQLGGNTVAIDLSALADIGEVQDSVQTLSEQTNDIAESAARIETGNTNVSTLVIDAQLALTQRFDLTDEALDKSEANAVTRHEALLEAIAGITVDDDEHPELDEDDVAVVALLLHAQLVVLSGKRVPRADAEAIMDKLKAFENGDELTAAFTSAIDTSVTKLPGRSECFWALHDLIEDVTED